MSVNPTVPAASTKATANSASRTRRHGLGSVMGVTVATPGVG